MNLQGSNYGSRMEGVQRNFQFRNKMRKDELQIYFQERRKQMLQNYQLNSQEDIIQQLKTIAAQQQFLKDIGSQLTGEPNHSWIKIIQKLSRSVMAFNGEFDTWISQSIIKCLCFALKQQYKHLRLAPKICILLCDMVYLSWNKSTNFGGKLMQYEPVIDIINLGYDKNIFKLSERLDFLMLLGNICHYSAIYRQTVVRDGGGTLIVEYGQQLIESGVQLSQTIVINYISTATKFIQIFKKASYHTSPPLNLVYTLMPIVMHYYMIDNISNRLLNSCLVFLIEISRSQKSVVYQTLTSCQGLLQRTLNLIINEDPIVRNRTLHLISYFTYSDIKNINTDLVALKMFDYIQKSLQIFQSGKDKLFTILVLLSLSNMTSGSQKITYQLIDHPLCSFIMESASSTLADIQKQALCCLTSVLQNLKLHSLKQFLQKYEILRLMTRGLVDMQNLDAKTTVQIIITLDRLIRHTQNHFYVDSFNPLIDELQRVYNFTMQLQHIVNTSHNKFISQAANNLLLYLSQLQCQDMNIV